MMLEKQLSYPVVSVEDGQRDTRIFSLRVNEAKGMYIIHRALVHQLQDKRQKKANTKTKSEVRGGGKKPWKQKGTGRARAGSSRSPLWKGGGAIFGPKPKLNEIKINKKEKQLALRTLLYNKYKDTIIVNSSILNTPQISTKNILTKIGLIGINVNDNRKILIIVHKKHTNLYLSTRNIRHIELICATQLNIVALLRADILIIADNALDQIQEVYNACDR